MYTTCVIWLAFVPLYFGTASHVPLRITSMAVTISLSASVTLVCLFSPKLYIILIRPERNVRQSIMPVRYSRKPPSLALPHPQNKKPPCADKGTQTDSTDFNKLTNGQTVQAKDEAEDETKDKNKVKDEIKDKTNKVEKDTKCNNVKGKNEVLNEMNERDTL